MINAKPEADSPWYMSLLVSWFPMLLLIGVWIFFMRQMQAGGGKAMSFGKSRARLMTDTRRRSPLRMWPASTRPRKNWRKSSNF